MASRRKSLLIIFITVAPILLIAIGSLLFKLKRVGPESEVIGTYIQTGAIDLNYRETLVEMATKFTKRSRFEGRVNTTRPPEQGNLNIYMLGQDPQNRFPDIKCNCAFIGENIILCDKMFFETFARSVDYTPDPKIPVLNEVNKLFNRWLGAWLLGHEIGHAVLHGGSRTIFQQAFERTHDWQIKEMEADEFVIAHIDPEEIQKFNFSLMNLVFQVYTRAYASQKPTNSSPVKIKVPADRIHGPWVQRALTIAALLEQHSPAGKSDSDYLPMLSSEFAYSDDGYDVGPLCDGIKIRGPNQ